MALSCVTFICTNDTALLRKIQDTEIDLSAHTVPAVTASVGCLDIIYVCCSFYLLLWLSFPTKMRKLSWILGEYKEGIRKVSANRKWNNARTGLVTNAFFTCLTFVRKNNFLACWAN